MLRAAEASFNRAVDKAIALHHFQGRSVVIMEGDQVLHWHPDGTKTPVAPADPAARAEDEA